MSVLISKGVVLLDIMSCHPVCLRRSKNCSAICVYYALGLSSTFFLHDQVNGV